MRPLDMQVYTKSMPFRPFKIKTVTEQTFDIIHPELIKLGMSSCAIFFPAGDRPDIYDWFITINLNLIEQIDFIEELTPPVKQQGPNGPPHQ